MSKQRKLKAEEKRFYAKRLKELSIHVASEGQLLFLAISQYLLPQCLSLCVCDFRPCIHT